MKEVHAQLTAATLITTAHALSFPEGLAPSARSTRTGVNGFQPLVLGGKEVPVGEKTYLTGLRESAGSPSFCGGSLISPKHVLTAAHCAAARPKFVSVGTHFLEGTKDGVQVAVTRQIIHPNYGKRDDLSSDLMILELEKAVTKVKPVALAKNAPPAGTPTTVTGWGTTTPQGKQSDVLLEVGVAVVDHAKCKAKLPGVDETMLCAGGKRGEDSCQGDSGGPLTIEDGALDVQVGVVSWGESCGVEGSPGVYSRIAVAKAWIDSVISGPGQSNHTVAWV